ncbi:hypothetical protein LJR251_005582 [Rhizobium rhizogenes]|uniref:hypothetical protein n=1 Tax=Rhizobium rhizogenes TaxID=359 RepID=UPI003ED07226
MFSAPSQYRLHSRQKMEVLLCLDHPAATTGIETILIWLGLDVTRASSFTDFRTKFAWGDVAFIVSQSNMICRIRHNTTLPIIDVEDFLFHQMTGKDSGSMSHRFDAAAFIDRALSLTELISTRRAFSQGKIRGSASDRFSA